MSDAPTESPSIGEVVDATTTAAADQAAQNVADQIPVTEPSSTTVVVEPEQTDVTATGLDAAAHMRQIAREEADKYMTELVAYDQAMKASSQPEVVVVQVADEKPPAQTPAASPEDPATAPEQVPDEAPPMARSHPYFRPIGKGKRGKK